MWHSDRNQPLFFGEIMRRSRRSCNTTTASDANSFQYFWFIRVRLRVRRKRIPNDISAHCAGSIQAASQRNKDHHLMSKPLKSGQIFCFLKERVRGEVHERDLGSHDSLFQYRHKHMNDSNKYANTECILYVNMSRYS